VLTQVALRRDGRAMRVEIKQSSDHRVLDEAAKE
jgi:outer membrane biosynthesis protein TonB